MFIGLNTGSVSLISAEHSFAMNLGESLLVLWLLSILVVTIAIFSSTFLSWPIAVILTLVILLGHWGVEQLGDTLNPGVGRTVAADWGISRTRRRLRSSARRWTHWPRRSRPYRQSFRIYRNSR